MHPHSNYYSIWYSRTAVLPILQCTSTTPRREVVQRAEEIRSPGHPHLSPGKMLLPSLPEPKPCIASCRSDLRDYFRRGAACDVTNPPQVTSDIRDIGFLSDVTPRFPDLVHAGRIMKTVHNCLVLSLDICPLGRPNRTDEQHQATADLVFHPGGAPAKPMLRRAEDRLKQARAS
jgi:hypothetical protein